MRVTIPELSLVLLIGPESSGKSTFAARHFRSSEVLSLDTMRRMVADDDRDEGAVEAGWGALLELAARRMHQGRLTVIDADLTSASRRQPLLQLAAEQNYIPAAFLFGRAGEAAVIDGEGFRRIYRFSSLEEIAAAEVHRLPLWSNRQDECGPFDIIGSVYGRYPELVALLRKLGYQLDPHIEHPRGRKLVFLGDLVDYGTRNADVLRLVINAVDSGAAYAVPGDHDDRLVRWLRGETVHPDEAMAPTIAELSSVSPDFRQHVETFLHSSVSHYVLDKGNLVVAHAGLKESLQGRGSAAVRHFALYGEARWVFEYQGAARVVYSHPAVDEPLWLNQTVNLCTASGLTALRYPEMQIVTPALAAPQDQVAMASK
jgi:protein phosphatase